MKTIKQLELLKEAHKFIKKGKTGSPRQLSQKLYISQRQLFTILEFLKEIGAPLNYDKSSKSYYYKGPFDLLVNVSVQVIEDDKIRTVLGGNEKR